MKTKTTNLRIAPSMYDAMRAAAMEHRISASEFMRRSMSAFTTGKQTSTLREPASKETTFQCPYDLYDEFKALAAAANVPMDEALRIAISTHLNEDKGVAP